MIGSHLYLFQIIIPSVNLFHAHTRQLELVIQFLLRQQYWAFLVVLVSFYDYVYFTVSHGGTIDSLVHESQLQVSSLR